MPHLLFQFDDLGLSIVQGLVEDFDVPPLILVGGAHGCQLHLQLLLLLQVLLVWKKDKNKNSSMRTAHRCWATCQR